MPQHILRGPHVLAAIKVARSTLTWMTLSAFRKVSHTPHFVEWFRRVMYGFTSGRRRRAPLLRMRCIENRPVGHYRAHRYRSFRRSKRAPRIFASGTMLSFDSPSRLLESLVVLGELSAEAQGPKRWTFANKARHDLAPNTRVRNL